MSDPLVELLAAPPSPPMSVDEGAVLAGGQRRVRRRRLAGAAATGLAACALGAAGWALIPHAGFSSTTPVATRPPSPTRSSRPAATSPLEAAVTRIAASPTAVALTLPDGVRVWVDPGNPSKAGVMRLAARSASGEALATASESTVPTGQPYNVTVGWNRSLLPDRVLVWGVDLQGSTNIKPDLAPGMRVAATRVADAPRTSVLVYVIDVRRTSGTRPGSVDGVTGFSANSPTTWPPKS